MCTHRIRYLQTLLSSCIKESHGMLNTAAGNHSENYNIVEFSEKCHLSQQ